MSNPNHLKISLLVPCYNASPYLSNFLDALKSLSFYEIIFFNDASTDDTLELLKNSGYKYLTSTINRGPAHGRNQLLQAASCEYVHFHDVDDILEPQYLNGIQPFFNGNYNAILCDADWVDPLTKKTLIKWEYRNKEFEQEGIAYLLRNPVGGINGLYKRTALLAIGGFDENLRIWEDSDLNLRLALNNKSIIFTESVLVTSIRYSDSASSDNSKIRKNKIAFLSKHLNVADKKFQQQLMIEANKIYHDVVYNKDWALYADIMKIFKAKGLVPPVTKGLFPFLLKKAIGSKTFTSLKLFYLKKFLKMNI